MKFDFLKRLFNAPPPPVVEDGHDLSAYYPWPTSDFQGTASPYAHPLIWIIRKEWGAAKLVSVADMSPEMNAIGLWWRPADQSAPMEKGRLNIDGSCPPTVNSGDGTR